MNGRLVEYSGETDLFNPSEAIWRDCNCVELGRAMGRGTILSIPFTRRSEITDFTVTNLTTGTFAQGDAAGGLALLDAGAATAGQGAQAQWGTTVGMSFYTQTDGNLYFEARVKPVTISSVPFLFIGLAGIDTTVFSNGTSGLLTRSAIGFKTVPTTPTTALSAVTHGSTNTESGSTYSQTTTGVATIADGTWIKLGFRVTNQSTVEFYVDGVLKATHTLHIPTAGLTPTLICYANGAQSVLHVDWMQAALQLNAA